MDNPRFTEDLAAFRRHLLLAEYAENTVKHYCKDVQYLLVFLEQQPDGLCKENLIAYKHRLQQVLMPTSTNRKIASINSYLHFREMPQLCLKSIKVQETTCTENELTRAEFERLLGGSRARGKTRLTMIILTLAGTGIRIGELKNITVQALEHGKAVIHSKGKVRTVIFPAELQQILKRYCTQLGISSGPLFTNKKGQPLSRSYVAQEMKKLAMDCQVPPEKVFPHNLRHLFARLFIECGYPVTDLADHLGHNNINTTRRYLVTSTATKQKQLSKLTIFRTPRSVDRYRFLP